MKGGVVSLGTDRTCVEVPGLDQACTPVVSDVIYTSKDICLFVVDLRKAGIDSMSVSRTLKNWRFSCTTCLFNDHTPTMKLTCLTTHP